MFGPAPMPGERNGNSTVTGCAKPSPRFTTTFRFIVPLRARGAFGGTISRWNGSGSTTAIASLSTFAP